MGGMQYGVSAAELLTHLHPRPLRPSSEPRLWRTVELPVPLQEYYNYLFASEMPELWETDFEDNCIEGCEKDWEDYRSDRFCLSSILDPDDCFSEHDALRGDLGSAAEYAETLTGGHLGEKEQAWLAQHPAMTAAMQSALAEEDYLILTDQRDWRAGIRESDWGLPDPPVWLRGTEHPGAWLPLTHTTGEYLLLVLLDELSCGSRLPGLLYRAPLPETALPPDSPEPPENGYLPAWEEEHGCALFLTRQEGRLQAMQAGQGSALLSEDSWRTKYLYDHLTRSASSGVRLEPFSLAAYCEQNGLTEQAALLRGTAGEGGAFELDDPLLAANLKEYRRMDTGLSDLSALAGCTRLKELRLPRNQIRDLSPIAGLVNLRDLSLSGNQIRSLEPLAGLTALGYLNLSGNPVTSAELNHLRKLKRLTFLLLNDTLVDDLTPLAGFRGRSLDLSGCPLRTGFEVLKTRTRLTSLVLDLATEQAYQIGALVPWLTLRVERGGLVQLASPAYLGE